MPDRPYSDRAITVTEAAEQLGMRGGDLWRLLFARKLPHVMVGRVPHVLQSTVDAYLRQAS